MRYSTRYIVTDELVELENDYAMLDAYVSNAIDSGTLSIKEELDYMTELMKLEKRIDELKRRK